MIDKLRQQEDLARQLGDDLMNLRSLIAADAARDEQLVALRRYEETLDQLTADRSLIALRVATGG